ncbi:hypothetical protein IQ215_14030 [Cyanobacterium stanieri LEGE 03274]|uniref:High light inducible protein n=1 Tax=Cyanobacterium stanieri LEGE 03274 TaxID=1828756 RepID=A0ABR9V7F3_9CHRO|nr:hypothetical protein [Cyanobacterium stanieri]MBE9223815.1 hypothetical protein [Cyanobacterium stanieri LEGE 03274]
MNSDLKVLNNRELFAPVVFRKEFNNFKDINANQAWSLFFTAGKEDKSLGFNPEAGKFFTNTLIGIIITGAIIGGVLTDVLPH